MTKQPSGVMMKRILIWSIIILMVLGIWYMISDIIKMATPIKSTPAPTATMIEDTVVISKEDKFIADGLNVDDDDPWDQTERIKANSDNTLTIYHEQNNINKLYKDDVDRINKIKELRHRCMIQIRVWRKVFSQETGNELNHYDSDAKDKWYDRLQTVLRLQNFLENLYDIPHDYEGFKEQEDN